MPTMDALDAWCPPTLTPEAFSLPRLAASTIAVAVQSTRWAMESKTSSSRLAPAESGRSFTVGWSVFRALALLLTVMLMLGVIPASF